MTAARVWKRGFVSLGAVVVVVLVAGAAHADVSFRKKAPPASDSSADQAAPSGGEPGTEESAPSGDAPSGPAAIQADDKDSPEAQALRDKQRADAALARQARNAELEKERERGTPFYQKWQFWAITGGVVVGAVLAVVAGGAIWHQMQGGDVRACNTMNDPAGCFGEGR